MKRKAWFEIVKGVPVEAISRKFPRCPKPLTEAYCKNNLWWWRGLETLQHGHLGGLDENDKPVLNKPHAGLVRHLHPTRIKLLALMNKMGAMEEWLLACESAEWSARQSGTHLPPPSPLTFWNNYHARSGEKFSLAGVTVNTSDSLSDVSRKVFAHLKSAGWKPGKGAFQRARRTSGRKAWASMFTAIEAVDRHYLLHQELNDNRRRSITNRLSRSP